MRLSTNSQSFWYSHTDAPDSWCTDRWATPFSGFRWAVSAYCGYEGHVIYMDTDTIMLDDIAALWRAPMFESTVVLARRHASFSRFCVSLWDCSAARHHLPTLAQLRREPRAYADCMKDFQRNPQVIGAIDPAYNNIDALAAGWTLDDYRNRPPFGAFVKKTERRHKGSRITRPSLVDCVIRLFQS